MAHPPFAQVAAEEPSIILAHVEVSDVRALFEAVAAQGTEFAQTLVKHPWGGTEFHVRDPDGNAVAFVGYPSPRR